MKKYLFLMTFICSLAIAIISCMVMLDNDFLFDANVAALAQVEQVEVKPCFINGSEGAWEHALFCDTKTSMSTFYSCPSNNSVGYKTAQLFCIK